MLTTLETGHYRRLKSEHSTIGDKGDPVDDNDVARLSPRGYTHINVHCRYALAPVQDAHLCALHEPNTASVDE